MLRIYIGYDPHETVAFHVLAHSIMRHSSQPVSISPLILSYLPGLDRPRDEFQSTDFAFSRFLVPWLCNYQGGPALFMDCDMLVRDDITKLFNLMDYDKTVMVVKHDYTPSTDTKFMGQKQSAYPKKNWSSVMLFNPHRCRALTQPYVNYASGKELHQFEWCGNEDVGELPVEWNHLVGEYKPNPNAKIVHYTLGSPCFAKYKDCEFANEWREEKKLMTFHNPVGEYSRPERVSA